MTTISGLGNNQTTPNGTNRAQVSKSSQANLSESNQLNTEKATFSSRAERLAILSSEFEMLSSDFSLSHSFINRMHQLGLVNQHDSAKLNSDIAIQSKNNQETLPLQHIQNTIVSIKNRISPQPHSDGLVALMNNSSQILSNIDASKSNNFPIDPATAAAELEQYLRPERAGIFNEAEVESLKDLKIALNVADKLSPEKRNSAQVSKYMEILNRYS